VAQSRYAGVEQQPHGIAPQILPTPKGRLKALLHPHQHQIQAFKLTVCLLQNEVCKVDRFMPRTVQLAVMQSPKKEAG